MDNKRKYLSVLSTTAIGTLIATALTGNVSAKTIAFLTKDKSGNLVKYDYNELLSQSEDKAVGLDAPLYDQFNNEQIYAYYDDVKGYVDAQIVKTQSETDAANEVNFNLHNFTENAKPEQIKEVEDNKVTEVTVKEGKVVSIDRQVEDKAEEIAIKSVEKLENATKNLTKENVKQVEALVKSADESIEKLQSLTKKKELQTRVNAAKKAITDAKAKFDENKEDENKAYEKQKATIEAKIKAYEIASENLLTKELIKDAKNLKSEIHLDAVKLDKEELDGFTRRIKVADIKVQNAEKQLSLEEDKAKLVEEAEVSLNKIVEKIDTSNLKSVKEQVATAETAVNIARAKGAIDSDFTSLYKLNTAKEKIIDLEDQLAKIASDIVNSLETAAKANLEKEDNLKEAEALVKQSKEAVANVTKEVIKSYLDSKVTTCEAKIVAARNIFADVQKANEVKAKIDKLSNKPSDVKIGDEDIIKDARKSFDELTPEQKKLVGDENKTKLEENETQLAKLQKTAEADKKEADKVKVEIEALPKVEDIKVENEDAITKARTDFDALTENQQKFVSNVAKLEAAEKRIAEVKQIQADSDAAIKKVNEKIKALPSGDVDEVYVKANKDAVKEVKGLFDALTKEQQLLVDKDSVNRLKEVVNGIKAIEYMPKISIEPSKETFAKKVIVKLENAEDVNGKLQYAIGEVNGEDVWKDYDKEIEVADNVTIYARAIVDDITSKNASIKISNVDKDAPTIAVKNLENDKKYKTVTPDVTVTDDSKKDPTVTMKLDDENYEKGTAITKEGKHTLVITATDEAGNEAKQTINFVIDATAPTVAKVKEADDVKIAEGAKSIEIGLSEKVEGTVKATVTYNNTKKPGDKDANLGGAKLSEDGLKVIIPSKDDKVLKDGDYIIKLDGIADEAGNVFNKDTEIKVNKSSFAKAIEIKTEKIAPIPNQVIKYEITDNYNVKHIDAKEIGDGKFEVTAKVKETGVPLDVAIADTGITFNASGWGKNTDIEVEVKYNTIGKEQISAKKILTIGEDQVVKDIKDITISEVKDSKTDVAINEKNEYDEGKIATFKLIANTLDQYENKYYPEKEKVKEKLITWQTSDKNIIAFSDDISTKEVDESTKPVLNKQTDSMNFVVKGTGEATITAYLEGTQIKKTFKINIKKAAIQDDGIVAPSENGTNTVEKEIKGFKFTNINKKEVTPTVDEINISFKSADKKDITAKDIKIEKISDNGNFGGVKVTANKSGVYTLELKYGENTKEFTFTSTADATVKSMDDLAPITIKASAEEKKIDLNIKNTHAEVIPVAKDQIKLAWTNESDAPADISKDIEVKYYKADDTEAVGEKDLVSKIGLKYKGDTEKSYKIKVQVTGLAEEKSAEVTCKIPVLTSMEIIKNEITANDKLIAGDSDATKYVDINLKDEEQHPMFKIDGVKVVAKNKDTDAVAGFATIVYKHGTDDKAIYNNESKDATGLALKFDSMAKDLVDGTYAVSIENADGSIKSNSASVVVGAARKVNKVVAKIDGKETAELKLALEETKDVILEAKDQYGDDIDIADATNNIKISPDNASLKVNEIVQVQKEGKAVKGHYKVTLQAIRGTAGKTEDIAIKFKDEELLKITSKVLTAGDAAHVTVDGKVDTIIHDTVIGTKDEYNTVAVGLKVTDETGKVITGVKVSDFTWDESELPKGVKFTLSEDKATFTVEEDLKNTYKDIEEKLNATVNAYMNGKKVGAITITIDSSEPTIKTVSFKDEDKVKEASPMSEIDLSKITLVAKDNYGEDAKIDGKVDGLKASDITNWKSNGSMVITYKANKINVSKDAKVGDEVIFTGTYEGKVVSFTVKVTEGAINAQKEAAHNALVKAAQGEVTKINSLSIEGNNIKLPTVDGYNVTIKSSSDKAVIAKDGTVTPADEEKKVNIVLTLTKTDDPTVAADTQEIEVKVPSKKAAPPVENVDKTAIDTAIAKVTDIVDLNEEPTIENVKEAVEKAIGNDGIKVEVKQNADGKKFDVTLTKGKETSNKTITATKKAGEPAPAH